ncbi:MAG TPA: outer membrane protein assembly factor BamA [Geopsychrobacteraceae bacterium]|nr:outer membrane protein assembly factor BamA [Geopsychrobacteraceae bacterium]
MSVRGLIVLLLLLTLSGLASAETYEIDDVVVSGNDRVSIISIKSVLKIQPGQTVSDEQIDQAVQDIFALGRFNNISADLVDREGAKVLIFSVSERPLLREVRLEGFEELSEEDLRELMTINVPELYDPRKVKATIAAFRQAYVEEGHHAAKIEPVIVTDKKNEAILTLKIDEGDNILVGKIMFSGNRVMDDDDLKDIMETREKWWLSWLTGRGSYREDMARNDVVLIMQAYHDRGYMDVEVLQPQVSLSDDGQTLELLIEINEGNQYQVGTVGIDGDILATENRLMESVTMVPGEVFNRTKLRESVLALNDLYADQGYAYVNVAPLTKKDKEKLKIDLTFDIEQGPLVHIDKIQIRGNTKTRDKVIRRQLELAEGDQYSASKIRESRRSVRNLGFFETVNVSDSESEDPSLANLDVEVTERPTGTFTLGVGYSSVEKIVGQGSISQNNFLGYGVKLDLAASLGGSTTTYRIGVTDPYFLDSKWTLGFDLYRRDQDWSEFSEQTVGGAVMAGYPLAKNIRGLLTYRYEEKNIFDVTPGSVWEEDEGDSTLSSVTVAINRNSTDYYQDPSSGGVSKFTLEYAGLGGTENFGKLVGSHRHFWPAFLGTVVSLHGQMGYVFETTDDPIPRTEKFFLGGLRSIRGFENRQVGPKEPDLDANGNIIDYTYIGGEKSAFFNLEYLVPISKSLGLKGVLFFDTGNAWLEEEDYFESMRYSAGAGIRWFSPLGPLRFEWGYNLDPKENEKQTIFEFSIGTAF